MNLSESDSGHLAKACSTFIGDVGLVEAMAGKLKVYRNRQRLTAICETFASEFD